MRLAETVPTTTPRFDLALPAFAVGARRKVVQKINRQASGDYTIVPECQAVARVFAPSQLAGAAAARATLDVSAPLGEVRTESSACRSIFNRFSAHADGERRGPDRTGG